MNSHTPPEPQRELPDPSWQHFGLYQKVREAIACLPIYFRTETRISGMAATDLHTLSTVLGATIEEQAVRTLNLIRTVWDPEGHYALYSFIRHPQTFPDVRFQKTTGTDPPLMGIEMKGWYLLAKEGEPSFRFRITPAACAKQDLIVIVPWVLDNVISGSPILYEPFIESARYAAEYRNYHWQHLRETDEDKTIRIPAGVQPYSEKRVAILDTPHSDKGGNFGRLARTGILDAYREKLDAIPLCGIKTVFWREFFRAFRESGAVEQVQTALERLRQRVQQATLPSTKVQAVLAIVAELEKLLDISG
jgi:hypothetical protein